MVQSMTEMGSPREEGVSGKAYDHASQYIKSP